jgi:hypothetical protein
MLCMSKPIAPSYQTKNWPAHNEALKRRRSPTIWFDPDANREAAPTGRRGRHQTDRRHGDPDVPDFSTLSRRRRTWL